MSFTDFTGGLSDASQYLSAQNPIRAELQGSVADIGRYIISAEYDQSLKEVICSLLAGRGLKLPDIQICVSLNLKELLGVPALQQELYDALNSLSTAMDSFLDHLKIDEVLGRINNVLGQATSIANMINFCSTPIDPVSIPNMLESSMQSFLGSGKDLINRVGTLVPGEISACLGTGGFNCTAFDGGVLGNICNNYAAVSSGTADTTFINSISAECASLVTAINDLIDAENDVSGNYDGGGSDFEEDAREPNTDLGVLFNPNGDINYAARVAGGLVASYDNLGSYQVVKDDGSVCNNIFELFVEPGLLSLLRNPPNPVPEISEQVPVYNYCGEIIGYTKAVSQEAQAVSVGTVPAALSTPGYLAGGLVTNPIEEGAAQEAAAGGTVINNITNESVIAGAQTYFAANEIDQLALVLNTGDFVFRTDQNITYLYNGGTVGDITDFETVGGDGASLSAFLNEVNIESGIGFLVRNGTTSEYRSVISTSNEITVSNGNGQSGNVQIGIADNPVIPGTDAAILPIGTTAQRVSTTNGAIRYNSSTGAFEGYASGAWAAFATGAGSVVGGTNVGGGQNVFSANNAGVLEFNSIAAAGGITVSSGANLITINDAITASNLGGSVSVFSARSTNDFQFRGLSAGSNIILQQGATAITIDTKDIASTVTTTDATLTTALTSVALPSNSAWYFEIQATAKRTDSGTHTASIKIEGILDNTSGTYDIAADASNKTVYSGIGTSTGLDATVNDNAGSGLRVQVTGRAAETWKWAIRVRYHEV